MGLAHKFKNKSSSLVKKGSRLSHSIGRKAPGVLNTVGKDMMVAGKAGEFVGTAVSLAGAPEVGVGIIGASEALKYGGKATVGASKTIEKTNKGDYKGAVSTAGTTLMEAKQNKSKYDKNSEKRNKKLGGKPS